MSKDNSGPAFPCTPEHSVRMNGEGGSGMSLRDYFAAKAMASLTSVYWEDFEIYESGAALNKCLCETAYEMADEMLAARSA